MRTDSSVRVIDLSELGGDELPAYAAIHADRCGNPFALSPGVMRWSEATLLIRLDDCREFWLAQKKKLRCKLSALFDPLLRHHYGEDYLAVFADHPWPCLLYLDYQSRHRGRGLFLLPSRLDRNIYRGLDWDTWFRPQSDLARHLAAIGAQGYHPERFRAQQAQLRRFVERLEIPTPAGMRAAEPNSMRRRFGKWPGLIWQWSFGDCADLHAFPWRPFRPLPLPSVDRDLEYPVNQWAYVEVLLREDFERLCEQTAEDDCTHINRLRWKITLFNEQCLDLDLSFRNPYSLYRDRPGYATALYQARYLYDDRMRELRARDHDLDLPASMPFIRWRLELTERILLAPRLWDLFAGQSDEPDYRRVMELQNKLPLAFESYASEPSFFPEHSFGEVALGVSGVDSTDHYAWVAGALNKPLFYCQAPEPIEAPRQQQKIFLERGSAPWWQDGCTLHSIRDYYILRDYRGRASWAFRTLDGAWYKQGEFH